MLQAQTAVYYDSTANNVHMVEVGYSQELIDELEKSRTDGKIKIGLIQDFEVVSQINPTIRDFYAEYGNWMKNIVTFRNSSILAHGMEAKTADEYDEFKDMVLKAANVLNPKINVYIEDTTFPEF